MRIGHGYDVHAFAENRRLVLGGVDIPHDRGLLGHSDADVLIHALMDALLGAAAMGDIGGMFPDNDPHFKDADSRMLLGCVCQRLRESGYELANADCTIIAQAPKLAQFIPQMRENIAQTMDTAVENVNIKATTEENLGFTGRREGISAHAVVLIDRLR